MPQVGKKKFPYTKAGEKQAAEYAAKTGQPMKYNPPKAAKKPMKKGK